jgi:hypothetical protein
MTRTPISSGSRWTPVVWRNEILLLLSLTLLVWTAITGLLLSACQTTASVATEPPGVSVACQVFQPIYWSKTDTPETQKQARAHNAAGVSLCKWKP